MPARVVITGLGVVSPIGIGVPQFWKAALEGARPAQKMIGLGPVGNSHVVMFWASQGGAHWTILSVDATGKTCAMAAGADWDQGRIPGIGERDA